MPFVQRDDATLHYEETGTGFPVLLIAPGGMESHIGQWRTTPWNPIEQLAPRFRVIAMDQRNSGRSTAPVRAGDGWQTYAADQLAVMDHMGIDRFHVAGMCIGGPYALGLIALAGERVASATLFQPIGLDDNRDTFYAMFDEWAVPKAAEIGGSAADWAAFRENMFGGPHDIFTVDEAWLGACRTPLLVFQGIDIYHPLATSRLVADTAPDVTYIERWREEPAKADAMARFEAFLVAHTPRGA